MFEDATDNDLRVFFPEADTELPTMFKTLPEFAVTDDGIVRFGEDKVQNMESIKGAYLVTPGDRLKRRQKTALTASGLPHSGVIGLDD